MQFRLEHLKKGSLELGGSLRAFVDFGWLCIVLLVVLHYLASDVRPGRKYPTKGFQYFYFKKVYIVIYVIGARRMM